MEQKEQERAKQVVYYENVRQLPASVRDAIIDVVQTTPTRTEWINDPLRPPQPTPPAPQVGFVADKEMILASKDPTLTMLADAISLGKTQLEVVHTDVEEQKAADDIHLFGFRVGDKKIDRKTTKTKTSTYRFS